jgi:hypothetical protein
MRSFTEFTLSPKSRPFVSLRVTNGEGFRRTLRVRFFPFVSLRVRMTRMIPLDVLVDDKIAQLMFIIP